MFHRAVAEMEIAYKLQPNDRKTARGLIVLNLNVAAMAEKRGATEEVVNARRRVVQVLDRLARDNPGVEDYDARLAEGYTRILESLVLAGRPDEASRVVEVARGRLAEATEESMEFLGKILDFEVQALVIAIAHATPPQAPGRRRHGSRQR